MAELAMMNCLLREQYWKEVCWGVVQVNSRVVAEIPQESGFQAEVRVAGTVSKYTLDVGLRPVLATRLSVLRIHFVPSSLKT